MYRCLSATQARHVAAASTHYAAARHAPNVREGGHVAPVGRQCSREVLVTQVNSPGAVVQSKQAVQGREANTAVYQHESSKPKLRRTCIPAESNVRDGGGAAAGHPGPHR
jgi:hypothetical protein